jgi:hypothetical protein
LTGAALKRHLAIMMLIAALGIGTNNADAEEESTWVIPAYVLPPPAGFRLHLNCDNNTKSDEYFSQFGTPEVGNGRVCSVTYWPNRGVVGENHQLIPSNEVVQVPTSKMISALVDQIKRLEKENAEIRKEYETIQKALETLPKSVLIATVRPGIEQIVKETFIVCKKQPETCK